MIRAVPVALLLVTAQAAAAPHKVRTLEGITEYKLDNGLQVLLFPDASQSTLTVHITYLVGSRFEGYGETGMAHLLEHMMFKGTPRHRDIGKLLEERGGENNASTTDDRTNYFETMPATADNLEWTLDMEADRMRNASIAPDDLKTEFSVVRNELEAGENQPFQILFERVASTAYLWHNYGKNTIGSRSDIERVPAGTLHAFYDKYYQPDNAMLIVTGKFDDTAALASIDKHFGSIPRPARKLAETYTVEPVQDGERSVTLRRDGEVSAIAIAYHTVAGRAPDHLASEAAVDILTHQASGRLYKLLVVTKLAASEFGYDQPLHDPGLAEFAVQLRDGKNVDKVVQIMESEIEGLAASKLDPKEVERWRISALKEMRLAMAKSDGVTSLLSEFAALGDWRLLFAYRDQMKKVTADDITRVAKAYLKPSNRTLGIYIPTKNADRAPLTEAPDIAPYIAAIGAGAPFQQGEAFAATLDNIMARTKLGASEGGLQTALLAKKTRGGTVELQLRLHWGDEKTLQGKAMAGDLLGDMLARGTAKHSFQDLEDLQDQLDSHVWFSSSATGLTLHIETLRDRLPAAFDLAAEMMTTPSFPADQFEIVRQASLANAEQQRHDPETAVAVALGKLTTQWPKADPRYTASPDEELAELRAARLEDVKRFYRDFAGTGHGELVVVGDFDEAALTSRVAKLAASWKSKAPYARLAKKAFGLPGHEQSIDIKDKEMTALGISIDAAMKDTDADFPAMLMLSQVLGGDTGSRLWMRLREHEGLSYGTSTRMRAEADDAAAVLDGYAIVAPQNLAKAKASMLDEVKKITASQVSDGELARAKAAWLKEQDTDLSNDGYVIELWVNSLHHGRTLAYAKDLRAKIQQVTAADISRAAKKWLDPARLTVVDAGDKTKAKPSP